MTFRIKCITLFDITATGVRSHYKPSRLPFVDEQGNTVADIGAWNYSRNQQRNWETLNQLISLRALPEEISIPVEKVIDGRKQWEFLFSIPSLESIELNSDPVGALLHDCKGVPMIIGLGETAGVDQILQGQVNIWFSLE